MVRLPHTALAELQQLRVSMVSRGEIFGLPAELVVYRGGAKPRYCLVAAVDGARAHLVPGTSKAASGPAVIVEVGETNLILRTEFDFSVSFPLALSDLVAQGRPAGSLAPARLIDIDSAIAASNLVAVKRLMSS
ncbi:MAG TPA: hypothetical protein VK655_11700 [Solirubrobacteraceae bacterium]|jgi:hypothetical protein|nr:hypothetical protein [Solirubrobacteraceae bacterium]